MQQIKYVPLWFILGNMKHTHKKASQEIPGRSKFLLLQKRPQFFAQPVCKSTIEHDLKAREKAYRLLYNYWIGWSF